MIGESEFKIMRNYLAIEDASPSDYIDESYALEAAHVEISIADAMFRESANAPKRQLGFFPYRDISDRIVCASHETYQNIRLSEYSNVWNCVRYNAIEGIRHKCTILYDHVPKNLVLITPRTNISSHVIRKLGLEYETYKIRSMVIDPEGLEVFEVTYD